MWTDDLDAKAVTLRPFPKDRSSLRGEYGVRVTTRRGVVYEGVVSFDGLQGTLYEPIRLNGLVFSRTAHTIQLLDAADVVVSSPAPVRLTDGEVRDLVADSTHGLSPTLGRADSVSFGQLVYAALGFDPTNGVPEKAFGGRGKDAYINQFLSVSGLKASLERLTADGVIYRAVAGGRFDASADDAYVSVDGKVGYLLMDAYNDAVMFQRNKQNDEAVAKLRREAVATIADRHRDEVEAELDRILTEKGLSR